MAQSILIVEDQKRLAASLRKGLEEEGFEVATAHTGEEGFYQATTRPPDALVLDIMLPGRDGFEVLRDLRGKGFNKPILILTSRDGVEDRVTGLNGGADDYLQKPFAFAELVARLRALLRRNGERELVLRADDLEVDLVARRVVRAGVEVVLSQREFELLAFLVRHKNEAVTRDMLAREVWKEPGGLTTNVIEVCVNALRKKVERSDLRQLIHTVRGVGYAVRDHSMARLGIRWKLTLWYGLVLAVLLTGFSAVVYLTLRHQLMERIDQGLTEELADVRHEVERARDTPGLLVWLDRRFAHHEGFDFQIVRADGTRFFASDRLADRTIPPSLAVPDHPAAPNFETISAGSGRWRVVTVRVRGPEGPLTVQVARSLAEFDHETAELLWAFLLAGPLTVGAMLAGGYYLAGRTLAPVERITETARTISGEKLNQRVPVANPGDELGRLAATLNEMLDRLERSFTEMQRFTADAAHELRTPLAVIRNEAEVALRTPRPADEYARVLEGLLEEVVRLSEMADQLLFLCRQDAGLNPPTQKDVALDELLRAVTDTMRPVAEAKGITLTMGDNPACTVRGDALQFRRVFYNLIDNAVKYTSVGGTMRVASRRDEGEVVVGVSDTGIGIATEHLPRVFDRFYRVDPSRTGETGGAGLGLAICRSVVRDAGGTITVTSVEGRGSVFEVRLPAVAVGAADL